MWQNFQKVLEKRVNNKKTVTDDKHLVMGVSGEVLEKFFGEVSKSFIQVKNYKQGFLEVELKNSAWRSEFKLNEKRIIKKINQELNYNLIKSIKIF